MTAATFAPAGTDLNWVTFSSEGESDSCQYLSGGCPAEPTHVAEFGEVAGMCPHRRKLYCLGHRDLITAMEAEEPGREYQCYLCPGSRSRLLRIEPLR